MRPRRWILALLLIPTLIIVGFLVAWRVLGLEETLRLQVLTLLRAQGLEEVELATLRPAWLGLDLGGVSLSRPCGGLRLEAARIRLRFSPVNWLKSPRRVLSAVDWIELKDFSVQLGPALLQARRPVEEQPRTLEAWLRLLAPALRSLPEIRLRGGRVTWVGGSGTEQLLVDKLEGLAIRQDGRLQVLLRSQLLDNRHQAFRAGLQLDPVNLDGHFQLALDSLMQAQAQLGGAPWLERLAWRASLTLGGRLRAGRLDSLDGAGRLQVSGAALKGLPGELGAKLDLSLAIDSLRVDAGELSWQEQRLEVGGALPWRLEGGRAWLQGRDLDLQALGRGAPDMQTWSWSRLGGRLELRVEGTWQDGPGVTFRAALREGRLDRHALGHASVEGSWTPGRLVLERMDWRADPGLEVKATGELLTRGGGLELELESRLSLVEERLQAWRGLLPAGCRSELKLNLAARRWGEGWLLQKGDAVGALTLADGRRMDFTGGALRGQTLDGGLPEGSLAFSLAGGERIGELHLLDGPARHWLLDLDGRPEALAVLAGLQREDLPRGLQGAVRLEGWGLQTEASASFSLQGRRARLNGRVAWSDSVRTLNADVQLEGWRGSRIQGEVELGLAGRRLSVPRLRLEGLLLSGWLDFDQRRYLAELSADDQPLQPFWDLLREDPATAALGSLSLLAAGEGSLDSLGLRGGLEWRQRMRDRQARLRADLSLDRQAARLERGRLSLDGIEWAALDLRWAVRQGPRELLLSLLDRDLAELLPPAEGRRSLLEGRLEGSLRVDLRQVAGQGVVGRLSVRKPRVGGQVFERLDLSVTGGATTGMLSLDSLVLTRGGRAPLRLEARGALPLGAGELDLDLRLAGDLLQPLTLTAAGRPSTFFHRANGRGEVSARLGGSLADPQLREGRLDLSQGALDMASIFRRVRDIEVHASVQGGRLQIERCEARLEDARLRISNSWDVAGGDQGLEHWVLDRPELDCGVISIETLDRHGQPGPVEINIPGLMEPDWSGQLVLRGAAPGELFWLAGPYGRPVLRGLAQVDNTEFTFPFIKSGEPPTPLLEATIAFLNSIEWDLGVQAGRNVNYWRKVQGFDDQQYMDLLKGYLDRITVDLYLDPTPQPLQFSGQIEDESFRLVGEATCSRGSVLFLDKDFEVEEAGMAFDATSLLPVVWGRAVHTMLGGSEDPGLQSLFSQDARQIWLQFITQDELGNRQLRGRWDDIHVELVDELNPSEDLLERGQEELLVDMGINPYDPAGAIGSMLPDVVAGFWEIPLRPVESRLRRRLGLDEVRIFLPVLRNTVEELLTTQTRQQKASQSYLDYLQGTRVILGKSVGARTFASWTGQLVASSPVEGSTLVRLFQRFNLDYEVSRNLSLSGEVVFDPQRQDGAIKGDPRLLLRYRQRY